VTVRIAIDGAEHTGNYRVDCHTCGDHWIGQGDPLPKLRYSPTLPVAEAITHALLHHPKTPLQVEFTARYREWLLSYWQRMKSQPALADILMGTRRIHIPGPLS
jgi:hypothetical protein